MENRFVFRVLLLIQSAAKSGELTPNLIQYEMEKFHCRQLQ